MHTSLSSMNSTIEPVSFPVKLGDLEVLQQQNVTMLPCGDRDSDVQGALPARVAGLPVALQVGAGSRGQARLRLGGVWARWSEECGHSLLSPVLPLEAPRRHGTR